MNWDEAIAKAILPATGLAIWFYFMWLDVPNDQDKDEDDRDNYDF